MKLKFIYLIGLAFLYSLGVAQDHVSINGAISVAVTNGAAATSVTIPDNVSAFRLTNVAGIQANSL